MYLDSSILVKLFVREPDSEKCASTVAGAVLVSSELAYGELWSALLQKEKAGQLTPELRAAAWADFVLRLEEESIRLLHLDVTSIRAAVEIMTEVHPYVSLRTLDAIHLAAMRSLEGQYLYTTDKRMKAAARFLEFPVVE
jgi:predicted nucleic acid-binding protein